MRETQSRADIFADPDAERSLIDAVIRDPALFSKVKAILLPDPTVFTENAETWLRISAEIESGGHPEPLKGASRTESPLDVAQHLVELSRLRHIAALGDRIDAILASNGPAAQRFFEVVAAANRTFAFVCNQMGSRLRWSADVLDDVLKDCEARYAHRLSTGQPFIGLRSGITELDDCLDGFNPGLYLLAGAPSVGKTTFALQIASHIAETAAALYITLETSSTALVLKRLAASANVDTRQIRRGLIAPETLLKAAAHCRETSIGLAFLDGTSKLSIADVRSRAMEVMASRNAAQCLIVVDYLQLWAKTAHEWRDLPTIRERVEALGAALREVAIELKCPVLALSSQNRAGGDYGDGNGQTRIDSLKESGDLEYQADVLMFLTGRAQPGTSSVRDLELAIKKGRAGEAGKISLVARYDQGSIRAAAR